MRTSPLIRVHPVSTKTPMRMITSAIGRVFTPPGGGVRVIEMRPTRQGQQGPMQMSIEVTETMKELEDAWPGFARLHVPKNDGGLEFLVNVEAIMEYSVVATKDSETQLDTGEAVSLFLEGRHMPILAGNKWGDADARIIAARERVDAYRLGQLDRKADTPDAGIVVG